jgi:hypothetical protein
MPSAFSMAASFQGCAGAFVFVGTGCIIVKFLSGRATGCPARATWHTLTKSMIFTGVLGNRTPLYGRLAAAFPAWEA